MKRFWAILLALCLALLPLTTGLAEGTDTDPQPVEAPAEVETAEAAPAEEPAEAETPEISPAVESAEAEAPETGPAAEPADAEEPETAPVEEPADAEAPETADAAEENPFVISGDTLERYTGDEAKVTVPDGVKKIAARAFANNQKLEEISLPDTVEEIGAEAFLNCEKLEKVNARKLKKIAARAFAGCKKLKDTAFADEVDEVAADAFDAAIVLPEQPAAATLTITTQPRNVTAAAGATVSFTVAATGTGLTYQWQTKLNASASWANTGLNGAKTATLSFEPTAAYAGRQYRCIVTDSTGSSKTSDAATLTIASGPAISAQPKSVTTAAGATISFTVTATGTGLTYQWQTKLNASASWANTGLNGAKTATLSFAPTTAYNGRQYRVIVTDANGLTATSDAATLTIASDPAISAQPKSVTTAAGATISFTVTATGTGLTYQWQTKLNASTSWANTGLNGAKTATLSFEPTAAYNGRQYRVIVTDANGLTATSDAATLTIAEGSAITGQPAALTVAPGETATFTVKATGTGLTYQWQTKNSATAAWANTGLNGNKTATLSFAPTAAYNGRQYRVIVTDASGKSVTSEAATLTVANKPAISGQPTDLTVAAGATATFTVKATGDGLTYQWQTKNSATAAWANTGLNGNKTATLSFAPTAAYNGRQYRVIITDANGLSVTSEAATLTVTNGPVITGQPTDLTAEAGAAVSITVKATGAGLTYQWQTKLSATSSWANTSLTGAKTATLTLSPTTAYNGRQYRVIITDANGLTATSNAATLTVETKPEIVTQPANLTVALGETATFAVKATGDNIAYQWQTRTSATAAWANTGLNGAKTATLSFTPTAAYNGRQYRVIITDAKGKTVTSSEVTLTVEEKPVIVTQPASQTVNAGAEVSLTVKATGTGLTYQWQTRTSASAAWANTGLTGNKTDTLTFPAYYSYNGRQYQVLVTDKNGAQVVSNAAILTVKNTAYITRQPKDATAKAGAQVTFSVAATGEGLTYQWQTKTSATASWANTGLNGAKTATLSFSPTAAYNGRQYRVIVTDATGVTATSDAATLTIDVGAIYPRVTEKASGVNGTRLDSGAVFTASAIRYLSASDQNILTAVDENGQAVSAAWVSNKPEVATIDASGHIVLGASALGTETTSVTFTGTVGSSTCAVTYAFAPVTYETATYTITYAPVIENGAVVSLTAAAIDFKQAATSVTVANPLHSEGIDVCKIGAGFMAGNTTVESIVLPETVEVIGQAAFKNCTSLANMTCE